MQHVILKQIFDIVLDQKQDAFHIQNTISEYYQHKVVPMFDNVFTDLSSRDKVLRIDRLELDLGCIPMTDLQRILSGDEFLIKIRQELYKKLPEYSEKRDSSIALIPVGRHTFSQWLDYMQKGYLPWNVVNDSGWEELVLETLATDYNSVSELRSTIQKDSYTSLRIVRQHDEFFLVSLVKILTSAQQENLPKLIVELLCVIGYLKIDAVVTQEDIKEQIWTLLLKTASVAAGSDMTDTKLAEIVLTSYLKLMTSIDIADIFSKIIADNKVVLLLPVIEQYRKKVGTINIRNDKTDREVSRDSRLADDNINASDASRVEINRPHVSSSSPDEQSQHASSDKNNVLLEKGNLIKELFTEDSFKDAVTNQTATSTKVSDEPNGIFIRNAGLVIVHPFLSMLFSRLGFTDNGKFVHENALHRAIYCLQYIAKGAETAKENELVINKILCGCPIEAPVAVQVNLTEHEKTEADNMLTAVIAQWAILKTTSIAGLRESFLQRSGKLESKNGQYKITVEQHSIDVLIDYLPWNLSIIKLPWQKDILKVEWR